MLVLSRSDSGLFMPSLASVRAWRQPGGVELCGRVRKEVGPLCSCRWLAIASSILRSGALNQSWSSHWGRCWVMAAIEVEEPPMIRRLASWGDSLIAYNMAVSLLE